MTEEENKFKEEIGSTLSETDNAIAQRLKAIFPTPEIQSKVVDLLVSKRPANVGRKSSYPYYKEYYARLIKKAIDEQIKTRETIIYRYAEFCPEVSEKTLYNRVNQSIRYLLDCLDPDRVYADWRKVINITNSKIRGGVVIELIAELRAGAECKHFEGELVVPKADGKPKWRIDMDNWIESPGTRPLIKEHLTLSRAEVDEVRFELDELKATGLPIMYKVDATCIKIMRLNV